MVLFITQSPKALGSNVDLGIYPPIIQIQTTPPSSVAAPITIENSSDNSVSLDISFRPFKPLENGDIEFLKADEKSGENPLIYNNMQIFEGDHVIKTVKLAPKQKKSLTIHIGINEQEKASDYYFSVLFISKASNTVGSTQSEAIGGIATNVLLSIGPAGPTTGKITQFSTPFFIERGPVPFIVKLNNTSGHYIAPDGLITIKNVFGQIVGKVDLVSVNVLSNSTRIIPSADKSILLTDPKALWNEKFLLGPYTARVTLGMSDEGPIYSKTTTFFAFPLELLAGILISICIVILIIKRVREKQVK